MKTAILLVGNIRTWDSCKENFLAAFGDKVDIFITTYNRQYAYHPYIQQSLNFYQDFTMDVPTIMAKFTGLGVKDIRIDDIDTYVDTNVKPFISSKFPRDAFLSLSQYFKLHDGMEMILKHEEAIGEKYDCIIKTRFDVLHNDFSIPPLENRIYVDGSGAGVFPCDWIFVSNRENAITMDKFIVDEMKDMKHESSLVDLPHKLFLNGIRSTGAELCLMPLIKGIVRAG